MKKILITLMVLLSVRATFAKPRGFYLVTPNKLEVKNNNELVISFNLPCESKNASDWSQVVMSYDDSGDRRVVLGIAATMSECGKIGNSQFILNVDLKEKGYSHKDGGTTFYPMTLKK